MRTRIFSGFVILVPPSPSGSTIRRSSAATRLRPWARRQRIHLQSIHARTRAGAKRLVFQPTSRLVSASRDFPKKLSGVRTFPVEVSVSEAARAIWRDLWLRYMFSRLRARICSGTARLMSKPDVGRFPESIGQWTRVQEVMQTQDAARAHC